MVLLTGTTGFIGKHLLSALNQRFGAQHVLALTSKPVESNPFLLHHQYSFNDNYFVDNGFSDVELLIHAGAFTPKNSSEANDMIHCNANIINTQRLLTAKFPKLRKIIYLSTLDVYQGGSVISEKSLVSPGTLYGASKWYSEKMVRECGRKKNIDIAILRIGHVYGPGEDAYQKIIPQTLKKILNQETIEIWGKGNELRSFIFIDDVVNAILKSIDTKLEDDIVNLVGAKQISINDLVSIIISVSGQETPVKHIPSEYESKDIVFDNARMRQFLLASETPLEQGLKKEWEFMKSNN